MRAELIEEYIWNQVVELVNNPDRFLKNLTKSDDGVEEFKQRIQFLTEQIDRKEKEKDKVKVMFKRDVISEDEMVRDLTKLNQEIHELSKEMEKYKSQMQFHHKQEFTMDNLKILIERVRRKMENQAELSYDFKRHIIELLFDEIWIKFEDDQLVITSVGVFDDLMRHKNDIGNRLNRQNNIKHRTPITCGHALTF